MEELTQSAQPATVSTPEVQKIDIQKETSQTENDEESDEETDESNSDDSDTSISYSKSSSSSEDDSQTHPLGARKVRAAAGPPPSHVQHQSDSKTDDTQPGSSTNRMMLKQKHLRKNTLQLYSLLLLY